jgi:glycosyltransferase involved in cell wall biosynthesis
MGMNRNPYFSIVIPAYNREREICRAIDSCLAQEFPDYEILIVDDGSTDGTGAAALTRVNSRIHLIRHPANRGVCPARNTGVRASTGRWVVFLDSDHEMRPECLSRAFEATSSADSGIDRFGFMYDFDDGRVSPFPLPPDRVLDYTAWLCWIDQVVSSDVLWITRRRCFDICMMPETFALEFSYHLDFARAFLSRVIPEHLAIEHTDSAHRLSLSSFSPGKDSRRGRRLLDELDNWTALLANHGKALSKYAPRRYRAAMRYRAALCILAGQRFRGLAEATALLRSHPWLPKNWALLLLTLLGPRPTEWVIAHKQRCGQRPGDHARAPRRNNLPAS